MSYLPDTAGWADSLRVWWAVSGMLVLLMQIGFIYLETACVRKEDRSGIAVKNVVMLLVSSLSFLAIGQHLMYGNSQLGGVFGWGGEPADFTGIRASYEWIFLQAGFAAVSATIVSGALAGRTTLLSNVLVAAVVGAIVFPMYGHWVWGTGFLAGDVHDFAGSSAVHFLGGMVALVGAWIAGSRRVTTTESGEPIRDMPLATLGVVFLWIGWIGFNGGSVSPDLLLRHASLAPIGYAVIATTVAACAGGLAALFIAGAYEWAFGRGEGQRIRDCFRQELLLEPWSMLGGTMAGMVAITANCDWVQDDYMSAAGIGVIGALAGFVAAKLVDRLGIDDPVEAISVHAAGGASGILLAASPEAYGLPGQVLGLFAAVTLTVFVTVPLFIILDRLGLLRVSRVRELIGLDFRTADFALAIDRRDEAFLWTSDEGQLLLGKDASVRIVGEGALVGELEVFLSPHMRIEPPDHSADHTVVICPPKGEDQVSEMVQALQDDPRSVIVFAEDVRRCRGSFERRVKATIPPIIKTALGWRLRLVESLVDLDRRLHGSEAGSHRVFALPNSRLFGSMASFASAVVASLFAGFILSYGLGSASTVLGKGTSPERRGTQQHWHQGDKYCLEFDLEHANWSLEPLPKETRTAFESALGTNVTLSGSIWTPRGEAEWERNRDLSSPKDQMLLIDVEHGINLAFAMEGESAQLEPIDDPPDNFEPMSIASLMEKTIREASSSLPPMGNDDSEGPSARWQQQPRHDPADEQPPCGCRSPSCGAAL